MKITIEAEPGEVAALIVTLQERQNGEDVRKMMTSIAREQRHTGFRIHPKDQTE